MKRFYFILLVLLFFVFSVNAVGYNVNFGLNSGITESLGGKTVQKNVNIWEEENNNYLDYLNAGGYITADIVITERFSIESGLSVKNLNLHYITIDNNNYGNGICQINYSIIQLPILAKVIIPIKASAEILNSVNICAGINISYNIGKQTYSDSKTKFYGTFITPHFNLGATLQATYNHKIGPGRAFAGLQANINFIPQNYDIGGRAVNIGNIVSVCPVIGYTFVIFEDKGLAHGAEIKRRITDFKHRDNK